MEHEGSGPRSEGSAQGSEEGALHTDSRRDPPMQELAPTGPETARNPGWFERDNTRSLKHGRYSKRVARAELPEQAEVRALLAEREAAIIADTQAESTIQRDFVRTYQTLWIIETHLTERIRAEGAITGKGKTRALVSTLLTVIDRKTRIAALLGIARKPKDANQSLEDWLRGSGDDGDEDEHDASTDHGEEHEQDHDDPATGGDSDTGGD